ncbi:rap guanine nucleotide exchange factor 3 isoform X1 [Polypterus senegalus]|uniref:rap guanine nucleotide exchange factor 3 isoform X1 n=2 Tax=Polypterus senegalus TaxID=55291 RepID=UPI001964F6DA|nr:rap guanine nucleotide exchange factor 3 isoform X1 [Polypterus senegalus]
MQLFRNQAYQINPVKEPEEMDVRGISWTPLSESWDPADIMKKISSERVLRASRVLYSAILERAPWLIRDQKYHLKTYRQCANGKQLVDFIIKANPSIQVRNQAVGVWQVLVDEGLLVHVRQELNFQDKDMQFYRFLEASYGAESLSNSNEKDTEEDLQEALSLLNQLGPDALLTMALRKLPCQRSPEDLEVIYEELLHSKAVAHLSSSVRRELAAVLIFESHAKAGTVLFSQGDKGTSWYIIWKGSVNVVTHGKGLVTTLHEGDDFGQLALVNDSPRTASIILREDNCHFLRVDKNDFNRILKDVEANTVRLEEHAKVVLVLEKCPRVGPNSQGSGQKYTVMSGTPEKILEHLLETVRVDTGYNEPADSCVNDFLLTHSVFMPTAHLCNALFHHYQAEHTEGSELEKAAYSLNKKQKVIRLVSLWVALYGQLLKADAIALDFLEELEKEVMHNSRLSTMLKEQLQDRRRVRMLENGQQTIPHPKVQDHLNWFANLEERRSNIKPIGAQDIIRYQIFKPDHSSVTLLLPVNAPVKEILSALQASNGNMILVRMNSAGEKHQLKLDTSSVFTSLGVNERLFACSSEEVEKLMPLPEQLGPSMSSMDLLEQISSKDIAYQMNEYNWELYSCVHLVEFVYYIFGCHRFQGVTTANLERFVRHFNEVQYWVVTEVCLCSDPTKRVQLLKKIIKIAIILKEQKNLNLFFAVMFGLSNTAVQRLGKTWERLPNKMRRIYSTYERLLDPSRNHRTYRLAVSKLNPPYVPFIPLLLKDITFIHEGNKTNIENLVNFEKMRLVAKSLKIMQDGRSQPYVPYSHQKTLADRVFPDTPSVRISTCSEQSLTVRCPISVRMYIQNKRIIDNQRTLTELSRMLEP